jgi:RNA polymerase sigma factor (sigma-70 family)
LLGVCSATTRPQKKPRRPGPTPDEALARRELGNALFRSLDELPLEQRVAFVLSVIEERPSHEVAEIVGAPSPTVRARVQAAKRRLRELLDAGGFR